MRYITRAERERKREREQELAERQRWMTLVEAIKLIKDKGSCDDHDALEDLVRAIVDCNVKALSGDFPYEEDSLSGYERVQPTDVQGELKFCLDRPGYIRFGSSVADAKAPSTGIIEYPAIQIVAGPVVKLNFDNSDLYSPPPIPEVNDFDFWPLLLSRNDMQKWPFAPEQELPKALSGPDETLSKINTPLRPNASPSSEGRAVKRSSLRHRREAAKEAIWAMWGTEGLPTGIMATQRDDAINKWLKERGRQTVSPKTIRRAFAELRRGRA